MANKFLFSSVRGKNVQVTDTANEAGGSAYSLSDKEALAQYVVTGCLNGTFYANAGIQLDKMLQLAAKVDAAFLADLAVYARHNAYMKDTPALLLAILSTRDTALFKTCFAKVVDNGKMLRNLVQILRSGAVGRKSLGTVPKRLVQQWIQSRDALQLLNASVGNTPSLADVIKMVHPKPVDEEQNALFAYLLGKPGTAAETVAAVRDYEAFKAGARLELPDVDFRLLAGLPLTQRDWMRIAETAPWQMTRMNLNTFARHGCLNDKRLVKIIAERLSNPHLVRKARAFPYQLMVAYNAAGNDVPEKVRDALQDAMEVALENVPRLLGKTYVLVDVSGSMRSPISGYRRGGTTSVCCVDVAALFAAALMKTGEDVEVIPFDTQVHSTRLNRRDSVFTLARKLAAFGGGGTACGVPLAELNRRRAEGDMVIYFSDNESWADRGYGRTTKVSQEWAVFKARSRNAKLVLVDLQPYATSQAQTRADILNIGGFSDQVFKVIDAFAQGMGRRDFWAGLIEKEA